MLRLVTCITFPSLSLFLSLSLSHTHTHTHTHTHSHTYYTNSPCGKKFRSKPQIARFLGESADLGCFDFSRAGTPGDGSQRRRARDRSAKKNVDQLNKQVPLVRPLTNNPLQPSGPIRRTCGVIKLPVIWVAPPTDDELKNNVMSAPPLPQLPGGAQPTGQAKPPEAPPKPPQTTALVAPLSSGAAELIVPHLWENRLDGVNPCSHETGLEIVVTVNKPQNGLSVCGTGALPDGVGTGATTTGTGTTQGSALAAAATTGMNSTNNLNANAANAALQNLPVFQSLIKQQQQKKVQLIVPGGGGGASGGGGISTSAAQSIIQSLKNQQLVSSATLLSQSGVVLTGASLSTLLRQQQLKQQQQQRTSNIGLTVTSGRTTTNAVNSTAVGSVSSIGMAAVGNGRLPSQDGAGSKLSSSSAGGHSHFANSQQQGHMSNIKVSLTAGAASTNPFGGGSVSASMVSNGPTIMNMDTDSDVGGSKFVSDSEIRLQEEKVRQLRQQLLAAAQAAAKGSAVV